MIAHIRTETKSEYTVTTNRILHWNRTIQHCIPLNIHTTLFSTRKNIGNSLSTSKQTKDAIYNSVTAGNLETLFVKSGNTTSMIILPF